MAATGAARQSYGGGRGGVVNDFDDDSYDDHDVNEEMEEHRRLEQELREMEQELQQQQQQQQQQHRRILSEYDDDEEEEDIEDENVDDDEYDDDFEEYNSPHKTTATSNNNNNNNSTIYPTPPRSDSAQSEIHRQLLAEFTSLQDELAQARAETEQANGEAALQAALNEQRRLEEELDELEQRLESSRPGTDLRSPYPDMLSPSDISQRGYIRGGGGGSVTPVAWRQGGGSDPSLGGGGGGGGGGGKAKALAPSLFQKSKSDDSTIYLDDPIVMYPPAHAIATHHQTHSDDPPLSFSPPNNNNNNNITSINNAQQTPTTPSTHPHYSARTPDTPALLDDLQQEIAALRNDNRELLAKYSVQEAALADITHDYAVLSASTRQRSLSDNSVSQQAHQQQLNDYERGMQQLRQEKDEAIRQRNLAVMERDAALKRARDLDALLQQEQARCRQAEADVVRLSTELDHQAAQIARDNDTIAELRAQQLEQRSAPVAQRTQSNDSMGSMGSMGSTGSGGDLDMSSEFGDGGNNNNNNRGRGITPTITTMSSSESVITRARRHTHHLTTSFSTPAAATTPTTAHSSTSRQQRVSPYGSRSNTPQTNTRQPTPSHGRPMSRGGGGSGDLANDIHDGSCIQRNGTEYKNLLQTLVGLDDENAWLTRCLAAAREERRATDPNFDGRAPLLDTENHRARWTHQRAQDRDDAEEMQQVEAALAALGLPPEANGWLQLRTLYREIAGRGTSNKELTDEIDLLRRRLQQAVESRQGDDQEHEHTAARALALSTAAAADAATIEALRAKLSEMERMQALLRDQNTQATTDAQNKLVDAHGELTQARLNLQTATTQLAELQAAHTAAQAKLKVQEARLAELETLLGSTTRALRTEEAAHKEALARVDALGVRVRTCEDESEGLRTVVTRLRNDHAGELAHMHTTHAKSMEQRFGELTEAQAARAREREQAHTDHAEAIALLTKQAADSDAALRADAAARVVNLEQAQQALQDANRALRSELLDSQQRAASAEQLNATNTERFKHEMKTANERLGLARQEIAALEADISSTRRTLDVEVEGRASEVRAMHHEILSLTNEIAQLKQALDHAHNDTVALKKQHDETAERLRNDNTSLDRELAQLRTSSEEHRQLTQDRHTRSLESCGDEIQQLRAELAARAQEADALRKSRDALLGDQHTQSTDIEQLRRQIASLTKECQLVKDLHERDKMDATAVCQAANEELLTLRGMLARERRAGEAALGDAHRESDELRIRLVSEAQALAESDRTIKTLRDNIRQRALDMERMRSSHDALARDLNTTRAVAAATTDPEIIKSRADLSAMRLNSSRPLSEVGGGGGGGGGYASTVYRPSSRPTSTLRSHTHSTSPLPMTPTS